MRVLRSVIQPFMRAVFDFRHDLAPGGCIGAELVGDHAPGRAALFLQEAGQQAFGGLGVAARLDDFIEHIAILIDGPPKPVLFAGNRDRDLVKVPNISAARPFALNASGVLRPELCRPAPDSLVRHDDAALQQHFLGQSQAQWEPEVQLDRMGNDLGWETVTFVADGLDHATLSKRLVLAPELM